MKITRALLTDTAEAIFSALGYAALTGLVLGACWTVREWWVLHWPLSH